MCVKRFVPRLAAFVVAVASVPSSASATRFGDSGVRIDLGDGMEATPRHAACGAAVCVFWSVRGFATPTTTLPTANMYAIA